MFYNQPLPTAPPPNPTLGDETNTNYLTEATYVGLGEPFPAEVNAIQLDSASVWHDVLSFTPSYPLIPEASQLTWSLAEPNPWVDQTMIRAVPGSESWVQYTPPIDTPGMIVPLHGGFPLQGTTVKPYNHLSQEETATQLGYVYFSENQYDRTAELAYPVHPDNHRQTAFHGSRHGSTASCPRVDTYPDTGGIDSAFPNLPQPSASTSSSHTVPTSLAPSYPKHTPLPELSFPQDARTTTGTYLLNPGLNLALPSSSSHFWFNESDQSDLSYDPRSHPKLTANCPPATTRRHAAFYPPPFPPPPSSDYILVPSSSDQSLTSPQLYQEPVDARSINATASTSTTKRTFANVEVEENSAPRPKKKPKRSLIGLPQDFTTIFLADGSCQYCGTFLKTDRSRLKHAAQHLYDEVDPRMDTLPVSEGRRHIIPTGQEGDEIRSKVLAFMQARWTCGDCGTLFHRPDSLRHHREVDCDKTTLEKKREIANHRVRGEYETLMKRMLRETGIPVLPGR